MATIIFENYKIRAENKSEFFTSLPRNLSIDDLKYKAAVYCIIKDCVMQFTLLFNSKHYLVRINCGEVSIKQKVNNNWHSLIPPFDPYFKKSKTKKLKSK